MQNAKRYLAKYSFNYMLDTVSAQTRALPITWRAEGGERGIQWDFISIQYNSRRQKENRDENELKFVLFMLYQVQYFCVLWTWNSTKEHILKAALTVKRQGLGSCKSSHGNLYLSVPYKDDLLQIFLSRTGGVLETTDPSWKRWGLCGIR